MRFGYARPSFAVRRVKGDSVIVLERRERHVSHVGFRGRTFSCQVDARSTFETKTA